MLRGVFIGAGRRGRSAHYPPVFRAKDLVTIEAIADLDPKSLADAGDAYSVPAQFTDYREMLDKVDCDVVYAITQPEHVAAICTYALDSGKHVFIEKPAGTCSAEAERIADAAEKNRRLVCVGLQRRWTPMMRLIREKVEERGPIRLMLAGMRKNLIGTPASTRYRDVINRLYEEDIHMVDYMRYVCGDDWTDVHTAASDHYTDWMNSYSSVIKFKSGSVGIHTCTGHAGARFYSVEMYGNGISAFLTPPQRAELYRDDCPDPEVVLGKPVAGDTSGRIDEGEDDMHRDFLKCIVEGQEPLTGIHEAVKTMRLCEAIGNLDQHGKPRDT